MNAPLSAEGYDGWYDTPKGRWTGEAELRLLRRWLTPGKGASLLDVGCGTGWFTRRLGGLGYGRVVGLDINPQWLAFARERDARSHYLVGDALALPFAADSFDEAVSVAALCFVPHWPMALKEMARVSRRRLVVGVLNRHSRLWLKKGLGSGRGGYAGAHWHTARELREQAAQVGLRQVQVQSGVFLPSGSKGAQWVEGMMPSAWPVGGFLVLSAEVFRG